MGHIRGILIFAIAFPYSTLVSPIELIVPGYLPAGDRIAGC
jgi:hypothetical protein